MTMNSSADGGSGSAGGRRSFIDSDCHFVGTYTTPNDLCIEGRYEGTIECAGALVVAESAEVNAQVTAGAVSVIGRLQGQIGCLGRFEILPTGSVEARVVAATIVIHEGARYQGEMRMGTAASESAVERSASSRTDPRPARQRPAAEGRDVPAFPPNIGRANGHSLTEHEGAASQSDPNLSSGRTTPAGE